MIEAWTGEYANQSVSFVSYDSSDMVNKLSSGCVAIIHGTSSNVSSGGTHYMAILDISEDKSKVYVSNPWNGSNYQGWLSVSTVDSDFGSDSIAYITNDGSSVNYGAGGNSSGSSANSNINMSQNITDNNRGGYKINVNWNEETQKMIKKLKEKDFDLNKYLLASNDNEHLRNLLKSAIVTQYPDLRSANEIASKARIDANETQGCIKIKRYADNETKSFTNSMTNPTDSEDGGMYMTYMPYDDFSDLISDNNESALNYFSMDRNNNLVIAGWETLDVQVSIQQTGGESDPNPDSAPEPRNQPYRKLTTKNVPYLDQVSNYAMPFSLLWTLLTYSDDEDFVNDVAKLVINTDIVIGIYDATNVKVTVYTNTYDKHVTTIDSVYVNGRKTGEVTVDHVYTYKVTETQTLKTDNPSLKLKYADTWAAVYKNDYQVSRRTGDPTNDSVNLDDETIDVHYGQANDENEINGRLNGNDSANQQVIDEKNRLKQETHQYNQSNFSYRYPILENAIDNIYNFSGSYVSVLKEEDIQNYIINMIIDENSDGYIEDQFSNNEIIKEYIDNANVSRSDVISAVKELVRGAKDDVTLNSSGENLWDQLTKNSQDTRKNQTYQAEITSIQYEDSETHRNQTENIETTETTARVQDVTNRNDKVRFKKDPNANENGFVKLLYFSRKAKGNLNFIDTWFFESVDDTAAIADLKDLLKYLFQCAFGRDYGIDEEEIEDLKDIFDPDKFSNMSSIGSTTSGVSGTSALSEFLKCWENSAMRNYINGKVDYNSSPYVYKCITEDKKNYIMCDDLFTGNGNRNFGFGICFYVGYSNSFINQGYFADEGVDITDSTYQTEGVSTLSVEIVDRVKERIIEDKRDEVRNMASSRGITLTDYQVDAVAACRYQGWLMDDFLDAYKTYGLNPIIRNYSSGMGTSGARYEANWKLFSTGVYTDENGDEIVLQGD